MHGCGLSRRKAFYIVNLAEQFRDRALAANPWNRMDDEQVIDTLVEIKGIGRWTAEMFLIFHLLRPDVLPVTDIGIQKAVARHYNGGRTDDARRTGRASRNPGAPGGRSPPGTCGAAWTPSPSNTNEVIMIII